MKLKFTPLLFLLLLSTLSFAQQKPIKVGLKAMPEATEILLIEEESRFTFSGGLQFVYPLSSRVSLESGLYYLDTGGAAETTTEIADRETIRTNFHNYSLSLPLQVRYTIGKALYLSAGPTIEYFVRMTAVEDDGYTYVWDIKGNPFRLGAGLAFGYEAPMLDIEDLNFFLEARVNTIFEELFQPATLNYGAGIGINYTINK
jgi:hypothetical protein